MRRVTLILVALLWCAANVRASEALSALQTKLKAEGFYAGDINGEYTSDTAAAVTRFQIRNGLQITGTLDAETKRALGVAQDDNETPTPKVGEDVWRYLRKSDQEYIERRLNAKSAATSTAAKKSAPARPKTTAAAAAIDQERLRDYVAAFVLAGLDPHVGSELEFFADRVKYFDQGILDREKIRRDLERYDQHWPERRFRLAGALDVQSLQNGRLRVSFPLRFQLRRGLKNSAGEVRKSLVLAPVGDDFQIVAVNEQRAGSRR